MATKKEKETKNKAPCACKECSGLRPPNGPAPKKAASIKTGVNMFSCLSFGLLIPLFIMGKIAGFFVPAGLWAEKKMKEVTQSF
jgi:hypothetical protein